MDVKIMLALAEPNRFNIIELLRGGPLSVSYIARRLKMSQPQTSKHLKVLAEAKIIDVQPQAQQRLYFIRPQNFKDMAGWAKSYYKTME